MQKIYSYSERLMSEICIEALVLYCNGELERLAKEENWEETFSEQQ